ncbi:hypothetical protein GWI33_003791 [Rhynchophorus ferrugineus]|uniref:Uncharacterized protein n=1 Tax=Rhynchophorus ferrugineus TaxID=354439 RepID=A0A834M0V1_RHYFE|nr:hypothetical protein GWI33_003798 [Rhynchophorus ferrugineus]KAF7262965.1 hypothetical protein GWI33_003791 [Rhynchophorus ferrugineus]
MLILISNIAGGWNIKGLKELKEAAGEQGENIYARVVMSSSGGIHSGAGGKNEGWIFGDMENGGGAGFTFNE